MGNLYFDATDIPVHENYPPMPEGWYYVSIVAAEPHTARNPDAGETLKLTVEINGNKHPDFVGRRHFSYLCINHKNDKPRNIAKRHLSSICHAIDLFPMESAEELLGAKLMVRLKIRPAKDGYEANNDIASWAAPEAEKTNEAPGVLQTKSFSPEMEISEVEPPPPSSTDNEPTGGASSRAWK